MCLFMLENRLESLFRSVAEITQLEELPFNEVDTKLCYCLLVTTMLFKMYLIVFLFLFFVVFLRLESALLL